MPQSKVIIWLIGIAYLLGVTPAVARYNESPILAKLVEEGKLPPVEERLPEEPRIIEPLEEIGQFGGALNVADMDPYNAIDARSLRRHGLFRFSEDCTKIVPDIAKDYEISKDKKTLTIYLRKGLKWSDGADFTVDDILFWWEDIMLNKELNPIVGRFWKPGGKLAGFEKVDDYTLRIHFGVPYPVVTQIGHSFGSGQTALYDPKHYLKKYHIKYNPKADELAKSKGYEHWWELFRVVRNPGYSQWNLDVNLPTLDTYIIKKIALDYQIWERNPYFWQVDPAGNQLPYIDTLIARLYENQEVLNMKVMSGEVDLASFSLLLSDYPLLKESENSGDYHTFMWKSAIGAAVAFAPNQNHPDLVLRKIMQDVRFRQALSLAINREEINEIVCFGLATPRQATILPTCSYYKEKWAKAYAEYDPQKANELLDEMNLKWNRDRKYRLRPDDKPLSVLIEYYAGEGPRTAICELVREYWQKIGIKVALKPEDRGYYNQRENAGLLDIGLWHLDCVTELHVYGQPLSGKMLSLSGGCGWAKQWELWFNTEGRKGEEPPKEIKLFYKDMEDWSLATTEEEYIRLAQKIFNFHAEYLIYIGTIGMFPWPVIAKNDLKNIPKEGWWSWDSNFWIAFEPAQFFFKQ